MSVIVQGPGLALGVAQLMVSSSGESALTTYTRLPQLEFITLKYSNDKYRQKYI